MQQGPQHSKMVARSTAMSIDFLNRCSGDTSPLCAVLLAVCTTALLPLAGRRCQLMLDPLLQVACRQRIGRRCRLSRQSLYLTWRSGAPGRGGSHQNSSNCLAATRAGSCGTLVGNMVQSQIAVHVVKRYSIPYMLSGTCDA